MNTDNPCDAPEQSAEKPKPIQGFSRRMGSGVLVVGLAILAYGATAFWLFKSLPPNGGASGRLPSLYVMGVGIVVSVLGMLLRDLRVGRKGMSSIEGSSKGVPTLYGVLGFVALLIVLFLVISRL